MSVKRLTVVGLGLIGGSIARAAKRASVTMHVRAVDADGETLAFALSEGLADEALGPDEAIEAGWFGEDAADLIVLATPVPVTLEWLETLARTGFTGIVTDVASTKRAVVDAALAANGAYRFIGGHPMAGSERSGVRAASETLFDGAYYILTPTDATDMDAFRQVHAFVASLGARIASVRAQAHDEAVAIISHVPHVAAAALVDLASARAEGAGADLLRLASGGFKDMTRIAAGSAELWTGICLDNADAVLSGIDGLDEAIAEFRDALSARDAQRIGSWFSRAAEVRKALPAQWVPATQQLRVLTVPVSDRPGVVGTVTTAASRAGCNIEDIEIDHRSEDTALLRLVLTDEGDSDALVRELESQGFEPTLLPLDEGQD